MNYCEIKKFDIQDGTGVRVSLFVSGCEHRCKGCFNSDTWEYTSGKEFTDETADEIIESLKPNYISGLSLLGGDPLAPKNRPQIHKLVKQVRENFGDKKSIWVWTGYTIEQLNQENDDNISDILSNCDYLIDGPFIESQKDLTLA